ncbi:RNB domain-containing ribonuclease [Telmatocola sphagniphila]|uniref:RNB domain-containing ribonuclease n=1 Tax=Telmatocola sphagniphila TaxID=1123043 RepID=A0A8E6B1A6_9BACT|nr:RNB domain-containing ribonuclease [Telmatocola sphagniphila]QVL29923.1 RNB domain-containing ribonuclease [Telmatocola sphagniphila]
MNDKNAPNQLKSIARRAMMERGLEPDFSTTALEQLRLITGPSRETGPAIRDQRSLLWCSIDNDTSKDLDQLSVSEKLPDGKVKVLVAIADVDAVVKKGSPLDKHASNNTTSVYTMAQIFPMLPEKLSTDLTSLNKNEDRIALVIEMVVAPDGTVTDSDIYRAVVNNKSKLAYNSVAAWLDGHEKMPDQIAQVPGMEEQLRTQDQIAQAMRQVRYLHGSLELESLEPEAILSSDGKITDLRLNTKNRAKELIEDFMIAANGVSARFLEKKQWPTLQRVVRSPERWDRIQKVAEEFGEHLPAQPDSKALSAFLTKRRQIDPLRFPDLSLTIVKLMGSGEYVVQVPGQTSPGHFGLAVREYSHSTAPNRRFPDLITQRMLKAALTDSKPAYSVAEMNWLATHCTDREDAANKVERQVRKSAAAQFLSDRIGQVFDALITGKNDKGTWVRVITPPVEGKLTDTPADVDVGDQIKVKLTSLNVERGFIDFTRVGTEKKIAVRPNSH